MEEINKLRLFYKLKNVQRANSVGDRKESPAEHTWSSLILADYFLNIIDKKIDRLKVYELLMYHDVIEIEVGDVSIINVDERVDLEKKEMNAMHSFKNKIPLSMKDKFVNLFTEYQGQKTIESKFAKAIQSLDAKIHEIDYKEDWKGWTEKFLRSAKEKYFKEFPEMQEMFEKTIAFVKKEGYFDQ